MSALSPAAETLASARTRFDVASLLPVVAPLTLLALALVAVAPGLVVQDSWLTLVGGREVAHHWLPRADHLTVMGSGHRWVYQQWLAGLILYGAARGGGVGLAFALCILAVLIAFGVAALVAHGRGASPRTILLFLVAAVAAAPWGLQLRAQALALPLFALVLWLVLRDPRAERRSTLLVLPLLCLWANVHGSVVVGVAIVLAYAAAVRKPLYGLAPAALFASPYAASLPGYYRLMLLDPPFGRYVTEWHRTTPSPLTATFLALAAVAAALAVLRRSRLSLLDALVLALTLAVALEAIRGLIWFALAALALLPGLATRRPGSVRLAGRGAGVFAAAGLAAVAVGLLVAAVRPASAYEPRLPDRVAELVASRPAESVLADDTAADWLLWRVPSLAGRLAYDVRFEILSRHQIERLVAWRGLKPGWRAAGTGYSLVVDDPRHVARLTAAGGWRRLFASRYVAVAERSRGAR